MIPWRRLKYLLPFYRNAEERDMREELQSLRAIAGAHEIGNLTVLAENARAVWGWNWLSDLSRDLAYSLRTLLRHRSVTLIAVLSIALGIGANTLLFSLVNALIFRTLPYPEPSRLVAVGFSPENELGEIDGLSRDDCISIREQARVFEHFGCYADDFSASLSSEEGEVAPMHVRGQLFTAGMGRALGVNPLLGRWFGDADEGPAAHSVLVISHGLWQKRFGGTSEVLGKRVRVDGEPATVIGVMPDEFEFLNGNVQYWAPLRRLGSAAQNRAEVLGGVARPKGGIDILKAQAEMDVYSRRLDNKGRVRLQPLSGYIADEVAGSAAALQGIATFVLLIACANVAGLLLAQGVSQRRELAVRLALGSSRGRIIRQVMAHSLVLTGISSIFGVAVGWWGLLTLRNLLPATLPRSIYVTPLDSNVLLFTFIVALLFGLAAGVAPAIQLSRTHPHNTLRESSHSATAGIAHQRLRSAFVTLQIALAFILLAGAGLMIRRVMQTAKEDAGFPLENLLTVRVDLPEKNFRGPISEQIRQSLKAIPGVTTASGIAPYAPLNGALNMPIRIDDRPFEEQYRAQFLPVMADYFRTLEIRVMQGREFSAQDTVGATPVAVINETMARQFWPDESPLGKHVQVTSTNLPEEPMREVIGVVPEVKQYGGQQHRPQLYLPYTQLSPVHGDGLADSLRGLTFMVKTSVTVPQMTGAITQAVVRTDSTQAVSSIQTMRQHIFGNQTRRVRAGLVATFGAIAVFLAIVGIYGVISQIVNQRTNEIGIRIALGADPSQVCRLILRYGSRLITIGLILGAAGAAVLTRAIRSSLFSVSTADPLTFTVTLMMLGIIGLAACYVPARRASRIDPIRALRHE
jgi:predicted permease